MKFRIWLIDDTIAIYVMLILLKYTYDVIITESPSIYCYHLFIGIVIEYCLILCLRDVD